MKPEAKQNLDKIRAQARQQIEHLETWLKSHGAGPGEKIHDTTPETIQIFRDQIALCDAIEKAEQK